MFSGQHHTKGPGRYDYSYFQIKNVGFSKMNRIVPNHMTLENDRAEIKP